MTERPLIAVPGRFSASASAIRFSAVLLAEAVCDLVWQAGGEPLIVTPRDGTDAEVGARLAFADGVLLPGGGDLSPATYGQAVASDAVYDVNAAQDAFDLATARWALAAGVPLLAVCRGMQVVNVALGGTLEQDMAVAHRDPAGRHWHEVRVDPDGAVAQALGTSDTADPRTVRVSCHHHQRVDRLAGGLRAVAWAADGTVEAVDLPGAPGFFLGVQWHPEDGGAADPVALALTHALIASTERFGAVASS